MDSNIITLYQNKGDMSATTIMPSHCSTSEVSSMQGWFWRRFRSLLQESDLSHNVTSELNDQPLTLSSQWDNYRKILGPDMRLYIAFIDLTYWPDLAFDFVSRDGLFKILKRKGCPARLLSIIKSFHKDTKGTIKYDGSNSDAFKICGGVRQGCVLTPTPFISFCCSSDTCDKTEGIYPKKGQMESFWNYHDWKLIPRCERSSSKTSLFPDDAGAALKYLWGPVLIWITYLHQVMLW